MRSGVAIDRIGSGTARDRDVMWRKHFAAVPLIRKRRRLLYMEGQELECK